MGRLIDSPAPAYLQYVRTIRAALNLRCTVKKQTAYRKAYVKLSLKFANQEHLGIKLWPGRTAIAVWHLNAERLVGSVIKLFLSPLTG